MSNLALKNLAHLNTLDPSGILLDIIRQLEKAHNNAAAQVNASPVGVTSAPPQISAVKHEVLTAGVHKLTAVDNNPVRRGIHYIFEISTTPDFVPGTVTVLPPSTSRTAIVPTGAGPIFSRGYSQYQTSAPSLPVYAGAAVDAGGAARTGNLSGTGSGTESSNDPQAGAGFGFDPSRVPRLPR